MDCIGIPIIVIISYIAGEIYKAVFKTDNAKRFIPLFVAIVGGCLGAVIYCTSSAIIAASSIWDAILVGIISGESATGSNQIVKQLFEKYQEKQDDD